ncbi:MAG: GDSL-type esterase/lipase family protein [Bacillota bacterium]
MKINRFSLLFAILLVFNVFASTSVFAEGDVKEKNKIVALGDSIPYGYIPDETNSSPSEKSFPNLIAGGGHNVINLSEIGATSTSLLDGMKTNKNNVLLDLQDADLITLNIGSNDILHSINFEQIVDNKTAITDPVALFALQQAVAAASTELAVNLQNIVKGIRLQNSHAPIFVYNLYNPFGESSDPFGIFLNDIGNQIASSVNDTILKNSNESLGLYILGAYESFHGNQPKYVYPLDIHPTFEGHKALAALADQQLAILYPEEEVPSLKVEVLVSEEEETEGPIEVFIETNKNESVTALKWLKGSDLTEENFIGKGNEISMETFSFEVAENGTYTVYVESYEEFVLLKFTIENIKAPPVEVEEPPVEEEEPPVEEEKPPVEEEKPPVKEEPKEEKPPVKEETKKPSNGNKLPNTATNSYNYLVMGSGMLVVGFSVMVTSRVRSRKVNK